jgi:hypothetical protein
VDQSSPIARIYFTGVDRVKGIVIQYRLANGTTKDVGPYGAKPPPGSPHFELSCEYRFRSVFLRIADLCTSLSRAADEVLISASGIAGEFNGVKSVLQLNFVKYDKLSGKYTALGTCFIQPHRSA